MACAREGSSILPKMWEDRSGKVLGLVWTPWDSVRLRIASTHWNVPGKYVPRGELFFFLMQKEPVASNEVVPNPYVSAETLEAFALTGLHAPSGSRKCRGIRWQSASGFGRHVEARLSCEPEMVQLVFDKCHFL